MDTQESTDLINGEVPSSNFITDEEFEVAVSAMMEQYGKEWTIAQLNDSIPQGKSSRISDEPLTEDEIKHAIQFAKEHGIE